MASNQSDVEHLLEHIEKIELENASLKAQCDVMDLQLQIQESKRHSVPPMDLDCPPIKKSESQIQAPTAVGCSTPKKEDFKGHFDIRDRPILHDNVNVRRRRTPTHKSMIVKAATYDGSSSWLDYKAHFETCAEINNWDYAEKGLYLAVSLRGQAQGVFGNLSMKSKDYDSLIKALEERFAPPNQTELYRVQLRERRQRASESLSELGQEIRRLTNLAYPSAPGDLKETLAKEQFIDSLLSVDMRLRIKQSRPVDLNDAVRLAVELEAFHRAERAKLEHQGIIGSAEVVRDASQNTQNNDTLAQLQATVAKLEQQLKNIQFSKRQGNNGKEDRPKFGGRGNGRACFNCGSRFHLIAACPEPKPSPPSKNASSSKNEGNDHPAAKSVGSGLFIKVDFGNQLLDCLVDTGATLTILSTRVWEASELRPRGVLSTYDQVLVAASGDALDVKGKTKIKFSIHGKAFETEVVVANIENDFMMGLDFMEQHQCSINVGCKTLTIQGEVFELNSLGSRGCHRISVHKTVTIPARSEVIVTGDVSSISENSNDLFIVEPSERIMKSGKGLIARALVKGKTRVPIRMINPYEEDQCIHAGTHIGSLCPVLEVKNKLKIQRAPSTNVPNHLKELYERTVTGMTTTQCKQVAQLLTKYTSVFSESDEDLGRTGIVRHKIDTGDSHPIKQPLRRNPVHMAPEIDKQIDEMLQKNVIQPSTSPWSSGVVLVTKKDGSKRFCVDYRRLNDVTVKDSYPLPRIDDSLEQLAGAQWFSCLDLNSGYWQVELEEADRPKTAFNSRRGLFEFKVMPFGLCNAPATFERLMESVLAGLNWKICLIYLDDVIVHGRTFEEMVSNLESVLDRMMEAGLKLKPRKCQLFCKEVSYLGHVVCAEGVKTDPKKTEAIREWPVPQNATEVRSFLGLCSYYRKFIRGFSEIAKPLHKLTEKGKTFEWTSDCQGAFEKLKQCLVDAPILAHPDFTKEFILDTDASDFGIGAVLSQVVDGKEHAVAFASKSLSKAERRYCVTRKELYALVHFVKYFRHYLYGKQFTIRTDHGSLRWLMHFKNPEGQLARWLEVISAYDFKIEHRPGRKHCNADGLSRKPCRQCGRNESGSPTAHQISKVDTKEELCSLNLREAQGADAELIKLRHWLESCEKPDRKEIGSEGYFLKALLCQWDRLEIKDDLIVRRWEIQSPSLVVNQGIVPPSKRKEVLKYSHDIKASGHLGIKKTLSRIRHSYYWPGMQNDVQTYVSGCEACTKRKDPLKTKRAPMEIVRCGYPMERIAIDILGDFPSTERGNRYILVIGDYFSKWTESHAMPNMEARTIARILIDQVISRFGIPGRIHSDQGRQFESQLFKEMCSLLQIEKTRTTPYHAMSDGMVERFNKTLVSMLSAFVNDNHTDWDEHLQLVMMAYRSAGHETTGFSPNMCMLGRETTCPLDIVYEMPSSIKQVPLNQWVWELQEKLETAHKLVRQNTGEAMKRQKRYHDSKLSFETFEVGEKVYVYFPVKKVGCSSKLTSYWRGPYQVKERISDVLYKINCGRSENVQVIHCDRLRKCKSQTLDGENEEFLLLSSPESKIEVEPEILEGPEYQVDFKEGKRERRKPAWLQDYVLSLFSSSEMAKTKTTPRKAPLICSNCKKILPAPEDFHYHIKTCVMEQVGCDACKKTFTNRKTFMQHIRRVHGEEEKQPEEEKPEKEASDWEDQEECEVDAECDVLVGRTVRKRTLPQPVLAPKKAKVPCHEKEGNGSLEVQVESEIAGDELHETPTVGTSTGKDHPSMALQTLNVSCRVDREKGKLTRNISIHNNNEEVYSCMQSGKKLGEADVNLRDIIEENGMAKLSDVHLAFGVDGSMSVCVKYEKS